MSSQLKKSTVVVVVVVLVVVVVVVVVVATIAIIVIVIIVIVVTVVIVVLLIGIVVAVSTTEFGCDQIDSKQRTHRQRYGETTGSAVTTVNTPLYNHKQQLSETIRRNQHIQERPNSRNVKHHHIIEHAQHRHATDKRNTGRTWIEHG